MKQFLKDNQQRVEFFLNEILPNSNDASALPQAIRYVVFNGGKRLRPTLTYTIGKIFENYRTNKNVFDASQTSLNAAAASIELIHCYSMVHDDLPAMDNDDLRRGKPTCHIKFDEATAILTGDALLTLAFEVLSNEKFNPIKDEIKIKMINILSQAAGSNGMIMGQMQDIAAENKTVSINELKDLHALKTGKLFTACIHLGALTSSVTDNNLINELIKLGNIMGILFQVVDDILDETSNTEVLGKPSGSDIKNHKSTYVSLLGLGGAKAKVNELKTQANLLIKNLSNNESLTNLELLNNIVDFFVTRTF